ncbi:hypothetical protein V6N13_074237 [Hibiscus sabdariffa]
MRATRAGDGVEAQLKKLGLWALRVLFFYFNELLVLILDCKRLSDHRPILLKEIKVNDGPKPSKWFSHWVEEPDLVNCVETTASKSGGKDVGSTLREIKGAVKSWVKEFRTAKSGSSEDLELKMIEMENKVVADGCDPLLMSKIQALKIELWSTLRREEHEWLQKSRLKWL